MFEAFLEATDNIHVPLVKIFLFNNFPCKLLVNSSRMSITAFKELFSS